MTVFPAGRYYIGDLCYVFTDKEWEELCKMELWNGDSHEFKGKIIYSDGTAYGDGEYNDQKGNSYPVDSGTIGIAPVEILSKSKLKSNFMFFTPNFFDFKKEFTVESNNGWFRFGHIVIETGEEENDIYDYDEEEYEN